MTEESKTQNVGIDVDQNGNFVNAQPVADNYPTRPKVKLPYSEDKAHDEANEMQRRLGEAYGRSPEGPFDKEDYEIIEWHTLPLSKQQEQVMSEIAIQAQEKMGDMAAFEFYAEIAKHIKSGELPEEIMHLKDAQETITNMKEIATRMQAAAQSEYLLERYPDQNGRFTAEQYDEAEQHITGYTPEQIEAIQKRVEEIERQDVFGLDLKHGDKPIDEVERSYELTRIVQQTKREVVKKYLLGHYDYSENTAAGLLLVMISMNLSNEDLLEGEYKKEFRMYLERAMSGWGTSPMLLHSIISTVKVPQDVVVSSLAKVISEGKRELNVDRDELVFNYTCNSEGWDCKEVLQKASVMAIEFKIMDLKFDEASKMAEKLGYDVTFDNCSDELKNYLGLSEKIPFSSLKEMTEILEKNNAYAIFLKDSNSKWRFDVDELDQINKTSFSIIEMHILAENGLEIAESYSEDQAREIYQLLTKETKVDTWQDQENIAGPFLRAAEVFGFKQMFAYIKRKDVSRHDMLYSMDNILSLHTGSGLEGKDFFNNILQQVAMDGSHYQGGSSFNHLNMISQNISTEDLTEVLETAREFQEIANLQELVSHFEANSIFDSWTSLKKFYELKQALRRKDTFVQLAQLKNSGQDRLYNFVETLAFHPDSDISSDVVINLFWRNPARFLGLKDEHSGTLHERKKPSNYIEIPFLDLTATELRDALVEGSLDKIQSFPPFEIVYELPVDIDNQTMRELEWDHTPTHVAVKLALGSRKENIPGLAKNPPELFRSVSQLLKQNSLDVQKYLSGEVEASEETENSLRQLIFSNPSGIERQAVEKRRYRAKVFKKSDPQAIVAGNDTACCMYFGSGKNNVYTFNPNCGMFILQEEKPDGKWRTVCQSVLTEDFDIKTNISEVKTRFEQASNYTELLPEDVEIDTTNTYVAADNCEVARNFASKPNSDKIIEALYYDFFRQYFSAFPEKGYKDDEVFIGLGYSDALRTLPKVDNTYLPKAPVAYTDNAHQKCYRLSLAEDVKPIYPIISRQLGKIEKPSGARGTELLANMSNLSGLTHQDTLPVALIEGKAYADNKQLRDYLFDLENMLIAKDINNATKERANLSLKWQDSDGKMKGYLIAYEGKNYDQEVIYIADLAADPESRMAGGQLVKGFVELYQREYLSRGRLVPIKLQAREQTSYRLIQRHLDKVSEEIGIHFDLNELGTNIMGGDTMHEVEIVPSNAW